MALDRSKVRPAQAPQLRLSDVESTRLMNQIREDLDGARADHQARAARFARYYRRWRNVADEQDAANPNQQRFRTPLIQWATETKLARELTALFGKDAQIVAEPVGPEDQKLVRKVSTYMTNRVLQQMRIKTAAGIAEFRRVLNGRTHVFMPWVRDTFQVPLRTGGMKEEVSYDGPGFYPVEADNLIVPAERGVTSIQKFSFVIRRYWSTPDELLRNDGTRYRNIKRYLPDLVRLASERYTKSGEGDEVLNEQEQAEGVRYDASLSGRGQIEMFEWYGRWRMLRPGKDGEADALDKRELFESDLVIAYQPDLELILGAQNLAQMYPLMPERRPFWDPALFDDGSYWCMGLGEKLEQIEAEMSENANDAKRAGKFSIGPLIFYRAASGLDPETFEYQPNQAIPSEDPAGVKVIEVRANLDYPILRDQQLNTYSERVTGQSDMNMGRAIDRPNAPRTARQTMALLDQGDIRAELDLDSLRESWAAALKRIWTLDQMFAPPTQFFRVTEDDAGGLFDVRKGGAFMTARERGSTFDFSVKFATSSVSREAEKERQLALYQIDLGNPLVAQNPRALWHLLNRVHRAMGDDHFADLIPEPQDAGLPVEPKVENNKFLQGEDVHINPLDHDERHLIDHNRFIQEQRELPAEERDEQALGLASLHCLEHIEQMKQKRMMAALAGQIAQQLGQETGVGMQGLNGGMLQQHALLSQLLQGGTDPNAPGGAAPAPGQASQPANQLTSQPAGGMA